MALYVQKLDIYGAAVANLSYAQQDVHVGLLAYVFEISVFSVYIYRNSTNKLRIYIYICAKCCTAAPNICGCPVCNLLYATRLVPIIGSWFIDFWKICTTKH